MFVLIADTNIINFIRIKINKKKYQNNFFISKLLVYLLCQYRQTKLANMKVSKNNSGISGYYKGFIVTVDTVQDFKELTNEQIISEVSKHKLYNEYKNANQGFAITIKVKGFPWFKRTIN